MRIKEIIQESVSSIVFHATSLYESIRILRSGEFRLSADFAKEAERKIDVPMFYLSTSRSRSGEYHYTRRENTVSNVTVLIVLDGNRLNQNYRGMPVDYWEFKDERGIPLKDEMEDRIFSPTRTIPSIPYILSVDVYVDPDKYMHVDNFGSQLQELFRECQANNIELRIFDNLQDFLVGRRPINREEVLNMLEPRKMRDDSRRRPYQERELNELVAVGYKVLKGHRIDPESFPHRHIFYVGNARYIYERDNAKRQIDNGIFNATKQPIMEDLAYLMRQFNVRSATDLYELLLQHIYSEDYFE